jgi:hypothetical protein
MADDADKFLDMRQNPQLAGGWAGFPDQRGAEMDRPPDGCGASARQRPSDGRVLVFHVAACCSRNRAFAIVLKTA